MCFHFNQTAAEELLWWNQDGFILDLSRSSFPFISSQTHSLNPICQRKYSYIHYVIRKFQTTFGCIKCSNQLSKGYFFSAVLVVFFMCCPCFTEKPQYVLRNYRPFDFRKCLEMGKKTCAYMRTKRCTIMNLWRIPRRFY